MRLRKGNITVLSRLNTFGLKELKKIHFSSTDQEINIELPDEQKVENDKSYTIRTLRRASMMLLSLQNILKGFMYFSTFKLIYELNNEYTS